MVLAGAPRWPPLPETQPFLRYRALRLQTDDYGWHSRI